MTDSHLFKIARECSLKSDYTSNCSSARVGCITVYKGTILTKSFNSDKTHTIQAKYNKWRYNSEEAKKYLPSKIHAELGCIQRIKYLDIDFSKVHVYVYRETKNGKMALARPCPSCFAAIKELGIKNIHYSTENGFCHEKLI